MVPGRGPGEATCRAVSPKLTIPARQWYIAKRSNCGQRRSYRSGRHCSRSPAQHHVQGRTGQSERTPHTSPSFREDAQTLYPYCSRRPGAYRPLPLRPLKGPYNLPGTVEPLEKSPKSPALFIFSHLGFFTFLMERPSLVGVHGNIEPIPIRLFLLYNGR